jgi:hypothetical protein
MAGDLFDPFDPMNQSGIHCMGGPDIELSKWDIIIIPLVFMLCMIFLYIYLRYWG